MEPACADSSVPYIPECEIFYEDGPDAAQLHDTCTKNPGHQDFITVKTFNKKHLPVGYQTDKILDCIKHWCERMVRVSVHYTSPNRPNTYPNSSKPYPYHQLKDNDRATRSGTGYVWWNWELVNDKPCPCHECKASGNPKTKFQSVTVHTAAHVIYDNSEAEHARFELFYDSEDAEDRGKVKTLYGVRINGKDDEAVRLERCQSDNVIVDCVTHDTEPMGMLSGMDFDIFDIPGPPFGVIISHPHGLCKKISIGQILYRTIPVPEANNAPFKFGPGAKFRHSPKKTSKFLSETPEVEVELEERIDKLFATSNLSFKPADDNKHDDDGDDNNDDENPTIYTLDQDMEICLPADACYLCQFKYTKYNPWVTFPKATRLVPTKTLVDQSSSISSLPLPVSLPEDVEVNFESVDTDVPVKWIRPFYFTYSIATCPGSSGALVLHADSHTHTLVINHTGALVYGNNRSSMRNYTFR